MMAMGNDISVAEIRALPQAEIADRYELLAERYRALTVDYEEAQQQTHQLQRNLHTAENSVMFLSSELESVLDMHRKELETADDRLTRTVDTLKESNEQLRTRNATYEVRCDELKLLTERLEQKVAAAEAAVAAASSAAGGQRRSLVPSERELTLEDENARLKEDVREQAMRIDALMLELVNAESSLETEREKIHCLEDTLCSKREEFNEMQNQLELAQARNMELSTELAALRSDPGDANKKGNSLFAEVDDQRKKLIEMVATLKERYNKLRSTHQDCTAEILRLKRNDAKWRTDMKECSQSINYSNRTFRDELSKQVMELSQELIQVSGRMRSAEQQLIERHRATDSGWLDSLVSYYKNDVTELKEKLFQNQMSYRLSAENCWLAQQESAKWRFEALKSRCVISNRESLLDEHGITYESIWKDGANVQLDSSLLNAARPNVMCGEPEPTTVPCRPVDKTPIKAETDTSMVRIKQEIKTPMYLTPLANPLAVTPSSGRLLVSETKDTARFGQEHKSRRPLMYRDVVFLPKDATAVDRSAKKQQLQLQQHQLESAKKMATESSSTVSVKQESVQETMGPPTEAKPASTITTLKVEDKENVPSTETNLSSVSSKMVILSEKRTKSNIVIRRFRLVDNSQKPTAKAEPTESK